ncbi:MAG: ABC transporter substrate-binding protein, partial [Dehalococcoidia bacterium]|nr:ABC transporter substrate-binding protein [Dehalococcoidia bacterium]
KGRTVNMVSPASIVYYGLALSLAKQGLSLKDIKTVDLGGPETAGAFQKKDIDISLVFEPNATLFQDQGLAVKWGQLTVDSGPLDISPVLYSEKWAKENPELAKKFMVAYLKGHREYYTAVRKGPNRKEVIDIVINHTALKDAAMYEKMTWTSAPKEGAVDKESLRKLQDWLVQNGYQQNKVDIDSLVDNSYVLNANQVLGEFKP